MPKPTLQEALKNPAVGPRPISIEQYKARQNKKQQQAEEKLTAIPVIRFKRRGGKKNKLLRRRAQLNTELKRKKTIDEQRTIWREIFTIEKDLERRRKHTKC